MAKFRNTHPGPAWLNGDAGQHRHPPSPLARRRLGHIAGQRHGGGTGALNRRYPPRNHAGGFRNRKGKAGHNRELRIVSTPEHSFRRLEPVGQIAVINALGWSSSRNGVGARWPDGIGSGHDLSPVRNRDEPEQRPASGRYAGKSPAPDRSRSVLIADQRVLWVPSQTGALEDRLQPQKKTLLASSAVYFTGVNGVSL